MTDVLKFVRETYYKPNLKSGNKVNGDGGPEEFERQKRATEEVERMRMQGDPLEAAMQSKAHQCQELTLLAVHHLQERGLHAQILELGGDDVAVTHNVAVVGPVSNPLPANMKQWPPDVHICDPWSNIACSARDYPDQFIQKMKKWEDAGKLVGFQVKGFVLPTDPDWVHDVLHGQKMV
ncbi:ferredoxin [Ralstonia solanacearum]|nr:ferredoxin [Ralstonia solanacearum]